MRISCLQYTAEPDYALTESRLYPLLEQALLDQTDLVILPECALFLSVHNPNVHKMALHLNSPQILNLQEFARNHCLNMIIGSVIVGTPNGHRNRSLVINRSGQIKASYDKIHMFDVDLPSGEQYRESMFFEAGTNPQIVNVDDWSVGLSICFDLRFPNLYRYYAIQGVELAIVPAAFTQFTGAAHWHTLLRARAIENGIFIAACGMCGVTQDGRATYGHSIIYDPWGECLGELQSLPGCLTRHLERGRVQEVQEQIPVLAKHRSF